MKKLTLALSAAVALAASGSAMATSQNLVVDGNIQSVCTLNVSQHGTIALENNTWQPVADITGWCNSGQPTVMVSYLFTDHADLSGDNIAKFKHIDNNPTDFVAYRSQLIGHQYPPSGGGLPMLNSPFNHPQNNGALYNLEFKPDGSYQNRAGNYTTQLTVSVTPL